MGIDRIGKGGAPGNVPASLVSSASSASSARQDRAASALGVDGPFDPASAAPPAQASSRVEAPEGAALQQLRSGQITLDAYLDAKVHEATAPLALSSAELEAVRASLRDRLASDPTLVELVRCATGALVSPPHDE
jgi:hypothetical protein